MNNISSITDLIKVLRMRKMRAELAVADQQKVVNSKKADLLKAQAIVKKLNDKVQDNLEYRQRVSVQTDPVRICEAISHRKKIEYELERERYYENMARDEYLHQISMLREKKQAFEKIRMKLERIDRVRRTHIVKADNLQQDILEEESAVLCKPGLFSFGVTR